jgi:glycyl-tRNA synthetase beta chain
MEKSELVVELGVEEIPASMIEEAAGQFAELLEAALREQRLSAGERTVWYTPRRIIVGIRDIPERQEDLIETVTGPPKSVALDAAGKPTRAASAFVRKNGATLAQTKIISTPKGEYLAIERKVKGGQTRRILRNLIPACIGRIAFPKTMHWSPDRFRFARPLRWIVALYGGRTVRFTLADVTSSKYTSGHRFLGKSRIAVSSLASLQQKLAENMVLADGAERMARIREDLEREARACGGRLLEDQDLLRTVVNLNEMPSVVRGAFEERFLALPQEILITVMRQHQKYFSVLDNEGRLLPVFLTVINLPSDSGNIIRSGHERVLRARLADAAFFWDTDRKTRLADRETALRNVLFQEKLGSYYDKTRRVLVLLPRIAQALDRAGLLAELETAAHLFKCDLLTEMVKEFTDLEGVVGGLYARAEGYPENVWRAVYEQYLPKSSRSPSPSTDAGAILALADRLDTVCGCFTVGLVPSGSGDPFGVRRQGNGILKIILDRRFSLSLDRMIEWGLAPYPSAPDRTAAEVKEFLEGRLRFLFEEMGFAYDCIDAVAAAGCDDPLDAMERLRSLEEMRKEPDFLSLASSFKRMANILSQAGAQAGAVDESMLEDPAEEALWQCHLRVRPEVEAARKSHDYSAALRSLASMRSVVDAFFNRVMVMAEDRAIRANRLSLLQSVSGLFRSIADISRIVVEKGA